MADVVEETDLSVETEGRRRVGLILYDLLAEGGDDVTAVDERLNGFQLDNANGGRRVGDVNTLRVEDEYNAGSLGLS